MAAMIRIRRVLASCPWNPLTREASRATYVA